MSKKDSKSILIISLGYLPNIGGLETYLFELIKQLKKRNFKVTLLTYQPVHTPILGKWVESDGLTTIYRLPTIPGLFYKLLKTPFLEFLVFAPLQFITTPFLLFFNKEISTINAQGLISGFSGLIWSKILGRKYVITSLSIYHFPKNGLYRIFARWIFANADKILVQSDDSRKEFLDLKISKEKIVLFSHWEDTKLFSPRDKSRSRKKLKLTNHFIVSFFGRLVREKGILELLKSVRLIDSHILVLIYGDGPLINEVLNQERKISNLKYMGTVKPEELPWHYSAADLVVMPSTSEEGFGKVAVGALLCGVPVIASNKGALPEVVNDSVGKIVNPTSKEIAKAITYFYTNQDILKKLGFSARAYALTRFSSKKAEDIIKTYNS